MGVQTASAVGAALVALAFSLSTFERWLARRRPHELAWSAALLLFFLASAALAAGAQGGWNGTVFLTFYLLAGRRAGDRAAIGACLFAAFAAGVVAVAPLRAPIPHGHLPRGSDV